MPAPRDCVPGWHRFVLEPVSRRHRRSHRLEYQPVPPTCATRRKLCHEHFVESARAIGSRYDGLDRRPEGCNMNETRKKTAQAWVEHHAAVKAFQSDLERIANTPADVAVTIVRMIKDEGSVDHRELEEIAKEHGLATEAVARAIALTTYIFGSFPQDATTSDLVAELIAQKVVSDEVARQVGNALEIIERESPVQEVGRTVQRENQLEDLVKPAVPTLRGFWTRLVSVSSVPDDDDDTDDIVHSTPLVMLQVDIDAYGDDKSFAVALTLNEVEDLIESLTRAKTRMSKSGNQSNG